MHVAYVKREDMVWGWEHVRHG